jgi:hypothetical protein
MGEGTTRWASEFTLSLAGEGKPAAAVLRKDADASSAIASERG